MHPKGTYTQQPENITTSSASSENVTVISPYMTKKEVAAKLKVSVRTVERMTKSGQLRAVVIGERCVRYCTEDNKRLK